MNSIIAFCKTHLTPNKNIILYESEHKTLIAEFITIIITSTPLKHVLKPSLTSIFHLKRLQKLSLLSVRAAAICMHVNFPKWECYRPKGYTFYALGEILMRHSHTEATSRFRRNPNLHTQVRCSSFKLRVNAIPISNSTQSSSQSEMKITLSPLARGTRFVGRCPGKLRKA